MCSLNIHREIFTILTPGAFGSFARTAWFEDITIVLNAAQRREAIELFSGYSGLSLARASPP